MTTTTPDLWHHYGRTRAATDRDVPDSFYWTWEQDSGPGTEVLGDVDGVRVGDLGSGSARHAAHVATRHRPAQVIAVDSSPAQTEMATRLFGHLAPRLQIVGSDVVDHLHAMESSYDVLYSVFGAVDFTDPRQLLPAAAVALRPGGRLVFSTLAHYLSGSPAQPDVTAGRVGAKTPDGKATTMARWVLEEQVWGKLLDRAGFTDLSVEVWPATSDGPRTAATLLMGARRTR
ncbi:class I SAM-dependent methyltransferase [Streptomyces sp. WAC 01325]|uniref:class I SAM-dependent methyltransferase n=1 Tax=Streptomyces sp. WAC 01325 TaxID=2203202 RepID=UPI0021AE9FBF|nr:class I SAM-dependent methyltransferase [Streptomyces sp. WAC 01325]